MNEMNYDNFKAILDSMLPLPHKYLQQSYRLYYDSSPELTESEPDCDDDVTSNTDSGIGHTPNSGVPTATATVISATTPQRGPLRDQPPPYGDHLFVPDDSVHLRRTHSSDLGHPHISFKRGSLGGSDDFDDSTLGSSLGSVKGAKRWNSYGNIVKERSKEEFRELVADPNFSTLDHTLFTEPTYAENAYTTLRETTKYGKSYSTQNLSNPHQETFGFLNESTPARRSASPSPSHQQEADDSMHHYKFTSKELYNGHEDFKTPAVTNAYGPLRSCYGHSVPCIPVRTSYGQQHPTQSNVYGGADLELGRRGSHGASSSSSVSHLTADITEWQQKHQEQLRRQQYDIAQPMFNGGALNGHSGVGQSDVLTTLLAGDPHKLDAIKRAADNIIKEKDSIIERQKMKLMSLERQSKESESEFHKAMMKKVHDDGDHLSLKLQEVQYENASLKAKLTEMLNSKGVDSLEKKLGAREYEYRELQTKLDSDLEAKNKEITELKDKMSGQERAVSEWKDKYKGIKDDHDSLLKKIESLERYLADMPTVDESHKKSTELRSLKEDKSKYKHKASDLDRRLTEANEKLRSREEEVKEFTENEEKMNERIALLQAENSKLKSSGDAKEATEFRAKVEEEMEELKFENQRFKSDCEKAKKLLESKHRKLQQQEVKHRTASKELEERLSQEESAITAMKEELANKDQHLKKLRSSVKELGSKNQDLMEKNMVLQDKFHDLEKQRNGDLIKLERRLMKEMGVCFMELQSLVQICVQRAEGQDPNISVLLGVKASAMSDLEEEQAHDPIQSLKHKVSKVRELRQDIDKIRELISNKYAEDMGDNLNCTTQ